MNKIKISNRLTQVAKKVTKGHRVADIGCDHAYISIYLLKNNIAPECIAMDVNSGPLEGAKKNVVEYNCQNNIDLRLSDGAKKLRIGEADTILIAGMGGRLMTRILAQSEHVIKSVKELVLQPQSEIYLVRQYVRKVGFRIVDEDMIIDEGKYYVIIKAINEYDICTDSEYDSENIWKDEYLDIKLFDIYGRILLENKNGILKTFLEKNYISYNNILNSLIATNALKCNTNNKTYNDKNENDLSEKITELRTKLEYIRKGLEYYEVCTDN